MTPLAFFYGPLHVSPSDCLCVLALFVGFIQHRLHVHHMSLYFRCPRARHPCLLSRA